MIVDTSALLAILYQEDDAEWFVSAIATAPVRRMSAANFLEAAINIDVHGDSEASRQLDHFIRHAEIRSPSSHRNRRKLPGKRIRISARADTRQD